MTDRNEVVPMDFGLAASQILNRPLQPSNIVNCRPQSNLNKQIQSHELRLTAIEEQVRQANEDVETLRSEVRTAQQRLVGRASQLQSHLLTVVNCKYEEFIEKQLNDAKRRCCECKARADELEYDMAGLSRHFKVLASRLDHLENAVGLYSGKDRMY